MLQHMRPFAYARLTSALKHESLAVKMHPSCLMLYQRLQYTYHCNLNMSEMDPNHLSLATSITPWLVSPKDPYAHPLLVCTKCLYRFTFVSVFTNVC